MPNAETPLAARLAEWHRLRENEDRGEPGSHEALDDFERAALLNPPESMADFFLAVEVARRIRDESDYKKGWSANALLDCAIAARHLAVSEADALCGSAEPISETSEVERRSVYQATPGQSPLAALIGEFDVLRWDRENIYPDTPEGEAAWENAMAKIETIVQTTRPANLQDAAEVLDFVANEIECDDSTALELMSHVLRSCREFLAAS